MIRIEHVYILKESLNTPPIHLQDFKKSSNDDVHPVGVTVSIVASQAKDRGSIPRWGTFLQGKKFSGI